jgi:hypothetical protein
MTLNARRIEKRKKESELTEPAIEILALKIRFSFVLILSSSFCEFICIIIQSVCITSPTVNGQGVFPDLGKEPKERDKE